MASLTQYEADQMAAGPNRPVTTFAGSVLNAVRRAVPKPAKPNRP